MEKILILALILFCNINAFSQEIDKKYNTAVLFIQTNERMKDSIEYFLRENKMIKRRQEFTFNSFTISDEINFIDLEPFINKLKFEDAVSKNLLDDYRKKYQFQMYTIQELKLLSSINNSRIRLFFSKPIGNILVAEFVYMMNIEGNYKTNTIFGKGCRLAFIFNDENKINKVLYSSIIYN